MFNLFGKKVKKVKKCSKHLTLKQCKNCPKKTRKPTSKPRKYSSSYLRSAATVPSYVQVPDTMSDSDIFYDAQTGRSVLDPVPASDLDFGRRRSSFGKRLRRRSLRVRRRSSRVRINKKPNASIRKICKRLKIKITKKVGGRRVYKSMAVLKKQIKKRK